MDDPESAVHGLEHATADPYMECRGPHGLDAAFHLHACDSHTHGIADLRRLADQTHRAKLRLLLPLKLHRLQARPFSPSFEFHGSQQVSTRRPILIFRNVPDLEACVALKQIDAGNA